jgi:hypothetical protein
VKKYAKSNVNKYAKIYFFRKDEDELEPLILVLLAAGSWFFCPRIGGLSSTSSRVLLFTRLAMFQLFSISLIFDGTM